MALDELIEVLAELCREVEEAGRDERWLSQVHPGLRKSAQNLVHYLALRRHDLRPLQDALSRFGLSSLGRAEPQVLPTLAAVLRALSALARDEGISASSWALMPTEPWGTGPSRLKEHTAALLGPPPCGRSARIMVTMPSEAADDPTLVIELLQSGMDCVRINCAHDNAAAWSRMIENLRSAERRVGRRCQVFMDLAGPKIRTGPIVPPPGVMKLRPQRDEYGSVLIPGRVLLHAADVVPSAADGPHLPVTGEGLLALRPGSRLRFRDARGARRSLCVVSREPEGVWAQTRRTCYFVEGIELAAVKSAEARRFIVTALPPRPGEISLHPGDPLLLCRSEQPGVPVKRGPGGEVLAPAQIGCTLPRALDGLAAGQRVLFDDGRIAGVVQQVDAAAARIQITRTRPGGSKLRSDKGINLPDTPLDIAPLTEKDLADLPFIGRHADAVALSFANSPCDVRTLIDAIRRLGAGSPAIVIKVESRRGFENLPAMLLEAMRTGPCAVMIARGDLAVECGFERLAELQEEILWICEAAHVPVIWATQVLETLAKEGLPSRAEITDAAMGDRAECVMLNKGPHIVRAVQTLADILNRMHAHQWKKRAMLRGLRLAHLFFAPHGHEPSAHCG